MNDRLARVRVWAEKRLVDAILSSPDRQDAARRAGVRPEDWKELFGRQRWRCSICLQKRLYALTPDFAPDGYLRGVICQACRHGLAHFREDPIRLRRAAMYLEERRSGH
jgi:hypothetical protein